MSVAPEPEGEPIPAHIAWLAAIPIAALVGVTGASLWIQGTASQGTDAKLFEIIGGADGYDAMLHGSIAALTLASILAVAFRVMGPAGVSEACIEGISNLVEAMCVLFLAWNC